MDTHNPDVAAHIIIEKAKSFGASLAGIAEMDSLKTSPSHIHYQMEWPPEGKSALVLALAHQESEPELDWWGVEGGTPGNRRLQDIAQIIGANNLLLTPEFGPRVRLRALSLDLELAPTGPIDFFPCDICDRPCWWACPQQAFTTGTYSNSNCYKQMQADEANKVVTQVEAEDLPTAYIKYCRACELACPEGKKSDN
jgi:epoxyqueuosine reductase